MIPMVVAMAPITDRFLYIKIDHISNFFSNNIFNKNLAFE